MCYKLKLNNTDEPLKKVFQIFGYLRRKMYFCRRIIEERVFYMCTYIAEIKATYTEVGRETSRVARKSFSKPVELINKENFDIDEFLDAINIITKDLNSVTQATHDLIEVVRNNFCEISTSEAEELLELSHPIYDKMQKLYHKLLSSPFYKGMKTAVELYSDAMSEFDELCHDLKTFRIDLEQNDEFKEVERKLSEMLRR